MTERLRISSGVKWEAGVGYSRAVRVGNLVEVAGTAAVDDDGAVVGVNDAYAQLCDCNMTSASETYAHLETFLNDSFREAGWGFGHTLYSSSFLALSSRIDYVWHSNDFVAIRSAPGRDGGSDHVPIVTELGLSAQPGS
jgi:hypothetical protein